MLKNMNLRYMWESYLRRVLLILYPTGYIEYYFKCDSRIQKRVIFSTTRVNFLADLLYHGSHNVCMIPTKLKHNFICKSCNLTTRCSKQLATSSRPTSILPYFSYCHCCFTKPNNFTTSLSPFHLLLPLPPQA